MKNTHIDVYINKHPIRSSGISIRLSHPDRFIKSPHYTGSDFMFLYQLVHRRRPQILVHAITFEQLFGTIAGPDL